MPIDREKLRNFLREAIETNHDAWEESDYGGVRDPYWLGRVAVYRNLLEKLDEGDFDDE